MDSRNLQSHNFEDSIDKELDRNSKERLA